MSELLPTVQAEDVRESLLDYLTTTFALRSDGARLSLGAVRYVLRFTPPAVDRPVSKAPLSLRSLVVGGSAENCEDCGNEDQNVSCEDGSQGHGESGGAMEGPDDALSSAEMAVAEHSVPEIVDGCGVDENDGENNDDSRQNDGEETGQHCPLTRAQSLTAQR